MNCHDRRGGIREHIILSRLSGGCLDSRRTDFPTGSADPCSSCGPGATAKTGREEALPLGVEIRLRGARDAVQHVAYAAQYARGYTVGQPTVAHRHKWVVSGSV